jgi:hypothetical protein
VPLSRPWNVLAWVAATLVALGLGLTVGLLWPDDDRSSDRTNLPAAERCLRWFSDLHTGGAILTEDQRQQVRRLVRPGAFATQEEALFQLWSIGRRESCARAERFGFVGNDGSLGPGAIDILDRCFFFHSLKVIEPDAEIAEQNIRRCRRIDDAVGRDPDDFG